MKSAANSGARSRDTASVNGRAVALPRQEAGEPAAVPRLMSTDGLIFSVATLLAWVHTVDEVRIGELIAVPFALANLALALAWSRLSRRWKIAVSFGFGLFWAVAVIPYHVLPLLEGLATWQHISGLTRLVGGVMMVLLGLSLMSAQANRTDPLPTQ